MTVTDSNARSRVRAPLRSLLQRKLVCIKSSDQSFLALRTRRATAPAVFALLGAFGCGITVAAETPADAMAWLKKIAAAKHAALHIDWCGAIADSSIPSCSHAAWK